MYSVVHAPEALKNARTAEYGVIAATAWSIVGSLKLHVFDTPLASLMSHHPVADPVDEPRIVQPAEAMLSPLARVAPRTAIADVAVMLGVLLAALYPAYAALAHMTPAAAARIPICFLMLDGVGPRAM